jgi:hypothetical protein
MRSMALTFYPTITTVLWDWDFHMPMLTSVTLVCAYSLYGCWQRGHQNVTRELDCPLHSYARPTWSASSSKNPMSEIPLPGSPSCCGLVYPALRYPALNSARLAFVFTLINASPYSILNSLITTNTLKSQSCGQ